MRTTDDIGMPTYIELRNGETVVASVPQAEGTPFQTLAVETGGAEVDRLVVGGALIIISDFTLRFGVVDSEQATWGQMKLFSARLNYLSFWF